MIKKYWFWFSFIVIGYSVYDYFEHITRPNSTFEQFPIDWLLFTTAGVGSLLLITFGIKYGLEKLTKKTNILFEVLGVGSWLFLYINLLGPLNNQLFWPHDQLFFNFQASSFFMIMGAYFAGRIIIDLVLWKSGYFKKVSMASSKT